MPDYKLGTRVKQLRDALGLTQKQLVDRITDPADKIPQEKISRLEKYGTNLSATELIILAKLFGITLDEFVKTNADEFAKVVERVGANKGGKPIVVDTQPALEIPAASDTKTTDFRLLLQDSTVVKAAAKAIDRWMDASCEIGPDKVKFTFKITGDLVDEIMIKSRERKLYTIRLIVGKQEIYNVPLSRDGSASIELNDKKITLSRLKIKLILEDQSWLVESFA